MRRVAAGVAAVAIAASGIAFASTANAAPTKKISKATVAKHNMAADCWSIVGKNVYNLTSYVNQHPGGSAVIKQICGKNGTAAFKGEHSGESKPATVLAKYKIGTVK